MANPASHFGFNQNKTSHAKWAVMAVIFLIAPMLLAQGSPHVTGVEPASGKVNDSVTVSGESLGKDTVAGVFLSDDKMDYKATLVEQTDNKIVMKVPQVKPGNYNVAIQEGTKIIILTVRFQVN